MKQMIEVLARDGYWLLFVAVLGRQACVPVPANLLLLAAGALAGLGRMNFVGIVTISLAAFLLADLAWYEAGRRWGSRTLSFVCGATRNSTSREEKLTATFDRHGAKSLLISKFVIGLDAIAAPMSGISRMSLPRFLAFDAIGAILWASAYSTLGYVFRGQLDRIATYSRDIGLFVVAVGVAGLSVFVVHKLVRLYHLLHECRLARITPDELRSKLIAGENILILDLQGGAEQCQGLLGIPGSVRIDPRQLRRYGRQQRNAKSAMDREVILYCAGPTEHHSARAALALRRRGFNLVRPLAGSLQAWRDCGFPVTCDVSIFTAAEHEVYVLHEILRYSSADSAQILKTSISRVEQLLESAQERIRNNDCYRLGLVEQAHGKGITSPVADHSDTISARNDIAHPSFRDPVQPKHAQDLVRTLSPQTGLSQ